MGQDLFNGTDTSEKKSRGSLCCQISAILLILFLAICALLHISASKYWHNQKEQEENNSSTENSHVITGPTEFTTVHVTFTKDENSIPEPESVFEAFKNELEAIVSFENWTKTLENNPNLITADKNLAGSEYAVNGNSVNNKTLENITIVPIEFYQEVFTKIINLLEKLNNGSYPKELQNSNFN